MSLDIVDGVPWWAELIAAVIVIGVAHFVSGVIVRRIEGE